MTRQMDTNGSHFAPLEPRCLLSGSPGITINDVRLVEGDQGASAYVFTVSLSKAGSKAISVDFTTEDSSALAGEDYVRTSGTLNFARGETSKAVTVLVNGDAKVEQDETFSVKLGHARNAFLADARGIGTIVNDDVVVLHPPPPPPPVEEPTTDTNDYYTSPGDYYNDYVIEGTGTFY